MFPYRDDNPTVITPWVTIGIITLATLVWIIVQGAGAGPEVTAGGVFADLLRLAAYLGARL